MRIGEYGVAFSGVGGSGRFRGNAFSQNIARSSSRPSQAPQKGMHALKLFLAQKRACIGIEAVSNLDQSQKYIMCRMKSLYGMNSRGNVWRLYGLFNK